MGCLAGPHRPYDFFHQISTGFGFIRQPGFPFYFRLGYGLPSKWTWYFVPLNIYLWFDLRISPTTLQHTKKKLKRIFDPTADVFICRFPK
jgi:hypothetical protein